MINIVNLLWIVPVSMLTGALLMGACVGAFAFVIALESKDDKEEK